MIFSFSILKVIRFMIHDNRHEIVIELKNHNASTNCGKAVHMIHFLFHHFHKDCKNIFHNNILKFDNRRSIYDFSTYTVKFISFQRNNGMNQVVNVEHVGILTMRQFVKTRLEESMQQERLVKDTNEEILLRQAKIFFYERRIIIFHIFSLNK